MADVLIACDMIVASGPSVLKTVRPDRTAAVLNMDVTPTGEFQTHKDIDLGEHTMQSTILEAIEGAFARWAHSRACGNDGRCSSRHRG
jgi:indolepyruvate ferredoxin oxidoreductase